MCSPLFCLDQPALEEVAKARGANFSIAGNEGRAVSQPLAYFDSEVGDFVGIQVTDPTVNVSRLGKKLITTALSVHTLALVTCMRLSLFCHIRSLDKLSGGRQHEASI